MVFEKKLMLHTRNSGEMHDLTDAVTRIVSESGVRTGIVQIFNVGSTAAIGTIEFEPGLKQDLPALLRRLLRRPTTRSFFKWDFEDIGIANAGRWRFRIPLPFS